MNDKALLIIDMPSSCNECIFRHVTSCGRFICKIDKHEINNKDNFRPNFCPLKSLPEFLSTEHVDYAHEASEINGWNKCLKILLEDDLK